MPDVVWYLARRHNRTYSIDRQKHFLIIAFSLEWQFRIHFVNRYEELRLYRTQELKLNSENLKRISKSSTRVFMKKLSLCVMNKLPKQVLERRAWKTREGKGAVTNTFYYYL